MYINFRYKSTIFHDHETWNFRAHQHWLNPPRSIDESKRIRHLASKDAPCNAVLFQTRDPWATSLTLKHFQAVITKYFSPQDYISNEMNYEICWRIKQTGIS